jgi:hypothetical protein
MENYPNIMNTKNLHSRGTKVGFPCVRKSVREIHVSVLQNVFTVPYLKGSFHVYVIFYLCFCYDFISRVLRYYRVDWRGYIFAVLSSDYDGGIITIRSIK